MTHDEEDAVRAAVEQHWNIDAKLSEFPEGSLSRAWLLTSDRPPLVAKLARNEREHFDLGLRLSENVDAAGVRAGVPVRTTHGDLSVEVLGRRLAVLQFVPGRPPTHDELDPWMLGELLGRVHASIADVTAAGAWTIHAILGHARRGILPDHPDWVQEFILDAIARVDAWKPPREQMLRGDGFEVLMHDGAVSGLIDWGATRWGSVADDIGCWTVHVGPIHGGYEAVTRDLVAGYRTAAPLTEGEAAAIPIYQRLRLATRLAYVTHPGRLTGLRHWMDGWLEWQEPTP